MRIPYYQLNAFTSNAFGGNPAGVCVLEQWLPDQLLQDIATENNLSETAFFVPERDAFHLRWFTPTVEVDLCGHATLASAYVLFSELRHSEPAIRFQSRSGLLLAKRRDRGVELDFPSRPPLPCDLPDALLQGLGRRPTHVFKSRDYMALFDSEADVAALTPNMDLLKTLDCVGIIATAPGRETDFVSRFFAPAAGIPEDPVTGSAHCSLIPYWAGRLGKMEMSARQISKRGGELQCRHLGERVGIGGAATIYCRGELEVPQG